MEEIGWCSLHVKWKCRSRNHARQKQKEHFYSSMPVASCESVHSFDVHDDDSLKHETRRQKWAHEWTERKKENCLRFLRSRRVSRAVATAAAVAFPYLRESISHLNLISLISRNIIFHLLCRWRCQWSMTSVAHFLLLAGSLARSHTPDDDKVISVFNVHQISVQIKMFYFNILELQVRRVRIFFFINFEYATVCACRRRFCCFLCHSTA